ncbi:MAG: histidinol dehydrogenase [bacterium]|nr:histidinol dehydrogenase [bacterium]
MIPITYAGTQQQQEVLSGLRSRSEQVSKKVTLAVEEILDNVRQNKDKALFDYTLKFDGFLPQKLVYTNEELEQFCDMCDPKLISALKKSAENIKAFHEQQKQVGWSKEDKQGVLLGQRVRGLNRVGIYVPGGTAAYPSSVLMNAIPAKIAGVNEIVMVTPPLKGKGANPIIMAAAFIAGVSRVILIGGAQAVAALAYGTETVPKVDKIVGPGNIYVATAKRLVFGTVDIDMVAGPSEILILADKTANPKFIAADLMSQAEHDVLASAVLITTDKNIAEQTLKELEKQCCKMSRKQIIAESLHNYGAVIICRTHDEALQLANEIAPEHLEVCFENPKDYIEKIDNAGSVFLGNFSPEPLGDYYAGPNHVLPTSQTARFFSPLSVDSFIKKSSFIFYPESELVKAADDIITVANAEGLDAHANSVIVRL